MGSGVVELRPDPRQPGGWTLVVDGVDQSYVDLTDPRRLEFAYVRRLAAIVDTAAPAGRPLRVLHLGGGGLTLPRYVAATRPGSGQLVVEYDAELVALVQREIPLPADQPIEIMVGDARAAVEGLPHGGYDVILADVYRAAQMPRSVASEQFARHVADLLAPDGRYAVNVADLPPLAFSRRQAATLGAVFGDVCLIAEPGMLRGRRYGNVVLAAARTPGTLPIARLVRLAAQDPFPARLLYGEDLDEFVAGARSVPDASAQDSPVPPPGLLG